MKKVLPGPGKTHKQADALLPPFSMSDFAGISVPKLKNLLFMRNYTAKRRYLQAPISRSYASLSFAAVVCHSFGTCDEKGQLRPCSGASFPPGTAGLLAGAQGPPPGVFAADLANSPMGADFFLKNIGGITNCAAPDNMIQ